MGKKSSRFEGNVLGTPYDWLRHAESDLALARTKKGRTVLYQHLCFHAQQAAEKALKAILMSKKGGFPRTHDLAYLMDLLPCDTGVPLTLINLPSLTKYAVQERYPGEGMSVTAKDRRLAVSLAEHVVMWAKQQVSRKSAR